ncbi:MAG: ABC transporter substrate-binding protein [Alphaproteobacteria bacterium]|nr:MAG: ABC transporter substrate-binding protein [Alphaproteobacteria bacterium]
MTDWSSSGATTSSLATLPPATPSVILRRNPCKGFSTGCPTGVTQSTITSANHLLRATGARCSIHAAPVIDCRACFSTWGRSIRTAPGFMGPLRGRTSHMKRRTSGLWRFRTMPTRRSVILGGAAAVGAAATGYWFLGRPGERRQGPFRIGLIGRGEITSLDPAQAGTESPISMVWNIFDRLVQQGPDGRVEPRLAREWSVSPDRREWRFRIRQGVTFHAEGTNAAKSLTPADVADSLTRAVRIPGYARTLLVDILQGAAELVAGRARSISGLRVEGDTVVFSLLKPFNFLLDRLSTSFLSIVPAGTPDEGGAVRGTGAYELVSFDRAAQTVTLRRYPGHWAEVSGDAPETIIVRGISSEALGAAELRSGGLDYAEFNSSALSVMRGQAGDRYRIEEYPHTELRLIALNQTRAPFNGPHGPALGKALNLGIDRNALVARLGGGSAYGGPVPVPGFEGKQLILDGPRAQALVASVPPPARVLEMLVEPVDEARIIAELLVRQWAQIGLTVTPIYGRGDFFSVAAAGNYQMALAYYGPYVPSPEQYLWMYRAAAAPIPNVMRFNDPAFEAAFEEYVTVDGAGLQQAALGRALDELLDRAPTVWILKPPRLRASTSPMTLPRSAGLPIYAGLRWS